VCIYGWAGPFYGVHTSCLDGGFRSLIKSDVTLLSMPLYSPRALHRIYRQGKADICLMRTLIVDLLMHSRVKGLMRHSPDIVSTRNI
jgi:hypothetical protein